VPRQLVVSEFVTLDGVMEAPGGEPTHPHTGWVGDYMSPELKAFKFAEVVDAGCLLLGRFTYEAFAEAWPAVQGPFGDRMNAVAKHVVSSSLAAPTWNAQAAGGDPTAAAQRLRADDGAPILVVGSASLVHALLAAGVVDVLRLVLIPVSIGAGLRVFPDSHVRQSWQLADRTVLPHGVEALTYHPAPG
jgi:dihydrofolate reductase